MSATTLVDLLDRNARHVEGLAADHFEAVQTEQRPAAVAICCADSRVPQSGMWDVRTPGWLFTPSTIGNQAWDRVDGEQVVDGSLLYPLVYTGTTTAAVVGHTGCGAVGAALNAVRDEAESAPAGIRKWVSMLAPVIEDGLGDRRIEAEGDLLNQLVEFNVDRQVAFLQAATEVPDEVDVYGFVYDFQRVYGKTAGRAYLVNANGETDPAALTADLPARHHDAVRRLLTSDSASRS